MKVLIETHGCKLNLADSQHLATEFAATGYEIAADGEGPDIYVLNSCTVTQVADRKARQAVAAARRRFPGALIVATGCYAERAERSVAALAAVDLTVANRGKDGLVARVSGRLGRRAPTRADAASVRAQPRLGRTRASVKIQEGCDQVCAFCIVPKVRGRERSIPEDDIVGEVRLLAGAGCPEVVLTGTQLGSYGSDLGNASLPRLVARVLAETAIPRLRVSSLQPLELSDELLSLWTGAGQGRLCPHFHLPLQSGSDAVLARMRRRYAAASFLKTVERVRAALPECSVTTDIIAGFPGESAGDHQATLAVMAQARFADVHVFRFSSRPGTSASHFPDQVPPAERAARAQELRASAAVHAAEYRARFVGAVRPVLWEGPRGNDGLTDNYLRVRMVPSSAPGETAARRGRIENVRLVALDGEVLLAEPASPPSESLLPIPMQAGLRPPEAVPELQV
jgi:threonylcarbamoyladenosine tRNA methylthiotransferase MtaB